jgi:hypothetical protein
MADKNDELEARRWFRQRLAELGRQYPALKAPEHQQRLTEALEKDDPCHAPPPPQPPQPPHQQQPADPEDDPGEADS